MKEIILHTGEVALCDDEDYPLLSRFKWYLYGNKNKLYAACFMYGRNGTRKHITMHQMVMGGTFGVDHIDRNIMNNQKSNLRAATYQQNGWNKGKQSRRDKPSTSIYKGVFKSKDGWRVQIKTTMKGVKPAKFVRMGPFQEEVEAARVYNEKIVELRGEWAWVNPLPDTQLTQRY